MWLGASMLFGVPSLLLGALMLFGVPCFVLRSLSLLPQSLLLSSSYGFQVHVQDVEHFGILLP